MLKRKAAEEKYANKYLFVEVKPYKPEEMCKFRHSGLVSFNNPSETKYQKWLAKQNCEK
jgi:hypothetical protein